MTIGIFLGSIRDVRAGEAVANWVSSIAQDREGVNYELVDLKDYNLPLFTGTTPPMMMNGDYDNPEVTRWSEKISELAGFIFVTAEHNSSVPAPMKNAFDSLSNEWRGKPIAFIGYSYHGGVQTVKAWRQVISTFEMAEAEPQVSINLGSEFQDGAFVPAEGQVEALSAMLEKLEKLVAEA